MSSSVSAHELASLETYLAAVGWEPMPAGPAGTFWYFGGMQVAVPARGEPIPRSMWRSILARVANSMDQMSVDQLELHLGGGDSTADVAWIRVAGSDADSVAFDAGYSLIVGTHRMLRAAATTAQRSRAQIAGKYSLVGDSIASRARMGHSVSGSYKIPVLLPLSSTTPVPDLPGQSAFDVSRAQKEPDERRVMRTFAESLRAVVANVVEADHVTGQVIHSLIPAGVSREQLTAIFNVISTPEVAELSASFDWSPAYRAPAGLGESMVIPAGASERILTAARYMRNQRASRAETFSGPVIEIRQDPLIKSGYVTLQTIRRGRAAEVRVAAGAPVIDSAHEWMRNAETVIAVGAISSAPGRPLEIRSPDAVYPLSDSMLGGP